MHRFRHSRLLTVAMIVLSLTMTASLATASNWTDEYYGSSCQLVDGSIGYTTVPTVDGPVFVPANSMSTGVVLCPVMISTSMTTFHVQDLTFTIVMAASPGGGAVVPACSGRVDTPTGSRWIVGGTGPDSNQYAADRMYFSCSIPTGMKVILKSYKMQLAYVP
jgi:hypothetical protein